MAAHVPESRGAEQRVANRVRQSVTVGMTEGSFGERNLHAAQDELTPRFQTMDVIADADAMPAEHKEIKKRTAVLSDGTLGRNVPLKARRYDGSYGSGAAGSRSCAI